MKSWRIPLIVLLVVHAALVFAGFFAPYEPTTQNREFSYAPPTKIHWRDANGKFHLRPFVYALRADADGQSYSEEHKPEYPVRFFMKDGRGGLHLFGVTPPGHIFLLGTDEYGRDVFTRVLYGGRVSVAAALLATLLSLLVGMALGAIAGIAGGAVDNAIMRLTELGLALSWFYLLLAIRAFLPLHISPLHTFFLVAGVLGLTGWSLPARLIRGVVLTAKERGFVMSARGFGANNIYLYRRHILPQILPLVLTQAIILIPQFIMAEVALSFLGLGAAEPVASWGNLLAELQRYRVLTAYWWMATPILALVIVSFTYFTVANALRKRVQSVAV